MSHLPQNCPSSLPRPLGTSPGTLRGTTGLAEPPPGTLGDPPGTLTRHLEAEVAGGANAGLGGGAAPARDALLHPPLARHLHREGASCGGGRGVTSAPPRPRTPPKPLQSSPGPTVPPHPTQYPSSLPISPPVPSHHAPNNPNYPSRPSQYSPIHPPSATTCPGHPPAPAALPVPPVPTAAPTGDVLVAEFDGDDVVAGFGGAVGDAAGPVLQLLRGDVHLAGPLDGEAQPPVAWGGGRQQGPQRLGHPPSPNSQGMETYLRRGCRW